MSANVAVPQPDTEEETSFQLNQLPVRLRASSGAKIKDVDGNDLSGGSWFKIRFPDGSKLSVGQRDDNITQKQAYEAIVKPSNCGPAIALQGVSSLSEDEDAQFVGHVTWGSSRKRLTLHLSLNKAGNQLHWYPSNDGYGIRAEMVGNTNRVRLFGKDENGALHGLQVLQHGEYLKVFSDKWGIGLECTFVPI